MMQPFLESYLVKTGIAVGFGRILCVSSQSFCSFALYGPVVQGVVKAEHFCHPRERPIVVTPEARARLRSDKFVLEEIANSRGYWQASFFAFWLNSNRLAFVAGFQGTQYRPPAVN